MLTYANMNIKKHDKVMVKIMLKTNVQQIEGNEGFYFYLYPFGDLTQGTFQGDFYVHQVKKLLESLLN
jgi:hypothetical protein